MSQMFVILQWRCNNRDESNLASVVSTRTQSVGGTGVYVGAGVGTDVATIPLSNWSSSRLVMVGLGLGVGAVLKMKGLAVGLAVGTLVTPAALCAHPLSFHERVKTTAAISV